MHVRKLNKMVLSFPEEHPARRFLEAFIRCRKQCVGIETRDPSANVVLTLENGCEYSLAAFAYEHLSFDVQLDGWLSDSPTATAGENQQLLAIVEMRSLVEQLDQEALLIPNSKALECIDSIKQMLNLWKACIHSRIRT